MQWEQFLELGQDMDDSVIEEKIKAQKPEHCAVLIYTVSAEKFCIIKPCHMNCMRGARVV